MRVEVSNRPIHFGREFKILDGIILSKNNKNELVDSISEICDLFANC
jgi:hypothetical protein